VRSLLRHPRRVWRVLRVFGRYVVAPALPFRGPSELSGPVRMRLALEQLGGAWIKLGQMLAIRFDLLPAPYCDELFKLLNRVTPFPYEQVREIIRKELGDVPEVIFRSFETESFAAASIGQVHRAVLHSGERVAIKVQRPGIREDLQADIDLMYDLARFLDLTHLFGATRTRVVIDEFARWTADELDYLVEARQAVQLYENAQGERLEKIAKVYREYTTSRVLTTELIDGIPLIDILSATREGNQAFLDAIEAAGYDIERIVRHLDWNMLNQVYVYGYFHADLHPANLFVLPGDVIGYVDYGIVGQLPERIRESLTYYSWLLFRGDVEEAVGELMRWLAPTSATDAERARRRLIGVHQAFLYDMATVAAPRSDLGPKRVDRGADNPYSKLAVEILRIIRETELTLSQSLLAYLKMLVTLGTLRHQLAPDYDLPATARRFFGSLIRRQAATWLDPREALSRLYAGRVQVRRALEFVDFLEAQEPFLTEGVNSLFGIRGRLQTARRRLVSLGLAVLVAGGALYFVLADPDGTRRLLPQGMPYSWVHGGLVIVLVFLVLTLVWQVRRFGRMD
jgi:ubiquinone biosynthesis protein